jgi:hypothetical protein
MQIGPSWEEWKLSRTSSLPHFPPFRESYYLKPDLLTILAQHRLSRAMLSLPTIKQARFTDVATALSSLFAAFPPLARLTLRRPRFTLSHVAPSIPKSSLGRRRTP